MLAGYTGSLTIESSLTSHSRSSCPSRLRDRMSYFRKLPVISGLFDVQSMSENVRKCPVLKNAGSARPVCHLASTAGDRTDDEERFGAVGDGVRQRRIGCVVRDVFLERVKAHERA